MMPPWWKPRKQSLPRAFAMGRATCTLSMFFNRDAEERATSVTVRMLPIGHT
jgi:hypothetical protein